MATIIDISDCERVNFVDAFSGSLRLRRTTLFEGGAKVAARPMMWPCGNEALNLPHKTDGIEPDIDLYCIADAWIGGGGGHIKLDGTLVYAKGPYPYYIKHYLEHNMLAGLWDFSIAANKKLKKAFVIAHFNFIWGHWLTEIYPKLFIIKYLNSFGFEAPILMPKNAPKYILEIIKFTLPLQDVVVYDPTIESFQVELAVLPHMLNENYIFHDFLRKNLINTSSAIEVRGSYKMIFVSRRNLNSQTAYRQMMNESEIEDAARDIGFQIIHPESLAWEEQVRIFSYATVIAGEFGSGLHNAILSPYGAKVIALNWVGNDVQSRIGNFRGHDVGYIFPSDGSPRLHNSETANAKFSIDVNDFWMKASSAVASIS